MQNIVEDDLPKADIPLGYLAQGRSRRGADIGRFQAAAAHPLAIGFLICGERIAVTRLRGLEPREVADCRGVLFVLVG